MPGSKSTELIARQTWIDRPATALQGATRAAYENSGTTGLQVRDALHGTWLGHPLHAALTDIPIGAWTTAVLLDTLETVTGRDDLAPGADAAVGIGLIGAVGAAVTGITDYQHVDVSASARRVGMVHGILNVISTACWTASYFARKRDARAQGKVWGLAGFAIGMAAAKLGGELAYTHKVGVDHADKGAYPREFTRVMSLSELGEGQTKRAELNGTPVLVANRNGKIFAIAETCSHLGGPLSEGSSEGCEIECPWHGSRFSIEDGRLMRGPALHNQPAFDVTVAGNQILLRRQLNSKDRAQVDTAA